MPPSLLRLDLDALCEIFRFLHAVDLSSILRVCRVWSSREQCFSQRMVGSLPARCKVTSELVQSLSPIRATLSNLEIIIEETHPLPTLNQVSFAFPAARMWTIRLQSEQFRLWHFPARLTHLTIVFAGNIFHGQEALDNMCNAIINSRMSGLCSLSLIGSEGCAINEAQLSDSFLNFLQSTPTLVSLQLFYGLPCKMLNILTSFPNFQSLHTLCLYNTTIDDVGSQALARLSNLTHLEVHAVTDCSFLIRLPALRILHLTLMRDASGVCFVDEDSGQNGLLTFTMKEARTLTEDFETLIPRLPPLNSFTLKMPCGTLTFPDTMLRDAALQQCFHITTVFEAIQQLQTLTCIDLTFPMHAWHVPLFFRFAPATLRSLSLRCDRRCLLCQSMPPCSCEWETEEFDGKNRDPELSGYDTREDEWLHAELVHTCATLGLSPPPPFGIPPRLNIVPTPAQPLNEHIKIIPLLRSLRVLRLQHPTLGSAILLSLLKATSSLQQLELQLPAISSLSVFQEARSVLGAVSHLALAVGRLEDIAEQLRHLFCLHSLAHFRFSSVPVCTQLQQNSITRDNASNLPSDSFAFPSTRGLPADIQHAFGVQPQSNTFPLLASVAFTRDPFATFSQKVGNWRFWQD